MESGSAKSEPPGSRSSSSAALELRRHIRDLTSENFEIRSESVSGLEKFGERGAEALVETLLKKTLRHGFLRGFEEAFEEIGKPCARVLLRGLTQIREIRRPGDVYLIELFVETLGILGERRAAPAIAAQLGKLNRRIRSNHHRLLTDICTAAKVRIHAVLANLDSRAGLEDLLATLGDGRHRVPDGVVRALEQIGDRRALAPLVRLYAIEENVTFSGAQLVKTTIREIMRKERVASKDKVFRDLNPEERALLDKLLPRARHPV
jgi:HEAT repeat protein